MTTLSNTAVEAAIKGGPKVDRTARIAELEKQLEKVHKDIAEQERLDKWFDTVQSAYAKLKREMGKTLTEEEYRAIDGAYIFLHSGCVDLIRHIPAETSKGKAKRFLEKMDTAEAMRELASLVKR